MTLYVNTYILGRPFLGRTFAPTSGAAQNIGGGTPVVWAENVDAVDPLNTFTNGANFITVPSGAVFADISARVTIFRLNGSTSGTGSFVVTLNGTTVLSSAAVTLTAHSTDYPVDIPLTRIAVVAGQVIRSVPSTTSSAARYQRGTTLTFIDINWYA